MGRYAYGDAGSPPKIPGGATLEFEVQFFFVKMFDGLVHGIFDGMLDGMFDGLFGSLLGPGPEITAGGHSRG